LKILVLGNGLISTATAATAVERSNTVVLVSRTAKASDHDLERRGVELVRSKSGLFWRDAHIAAANSEVVVSALGVASLALVENQPEKYVNETREILHNLTQMVHTNSELRLIVITSGGTVYGDTPREGASEEFSTNPVSHYGFLNSHIEDFLLSSPAGIEGRIHCLRVANPYGISRTGVRSRSFADAALVSALDGTPLTVFGDGEQIRDFIHIGDVATLIAGCVEIQSELPPVLNIGTGIGHSLNEVTTLIEHHTGRRIGILNEARRPFDVQVNVLNSRQVFSMVGHIPRLLHDGLADYAASTAKGKSRETE
jgi:UDP-glucose 4-epimerase